MIKLYPCTYKKSQNVVNLFRVEEEKWLIDIYALIFLICFQKTKNKKGNLLKGIVMIRKIKKKSNSTIEKNRKRKQDRELNLVKSGKRAFDVYIYVQGKETSFARTISKNSISPACHHAWWHDHDKHKSFDDRDNGPQEFNNLKDLHLFGNLLI